MNRKGIFKGIATVILIAIFIFIIVVALPNIFNWKIDFMGINPSEQTHGKLIHLEYPPSRIPQIELNSSNEYNLSGLPLLSIDIGLQYNGILVEDTPVEIGATGFVYPDGQKIIKRAILGGGLTYNYSVGLKFESASVYDINHTNFPIEMPTIPVDLHNASYIIHSRPPNNILPTLLTISWDTQGDY